MLYCCFVILRQLFLGVVWVHDVFDLVFTTNCNYKSFAIAYFNFYSISPCTLNFMIKTITF